MRPPKNLGMTLAAVWFILYGVFVLIPPLHFAGYPYLMAVLAIAAGVLILMGR